MEAKIRPCTIGSRSLPVRLISSGRTLAGICWCSPQGPSRYRCTCLSCRNPESRVNQSRPLNLIEYLSLDLIVKVKYTVRYNYSRAFFAPHDLRVLLVLALKIHHVHPVPLIVQGSPRSDELGLRWAKWDRIEIRLPLFTRGVHFTVLQQWIFIHCTRCHFAASRVPRNEGRSVTRDLDNPSQFQQPKIRETEKVEDKVIRRKSEE